MSNYFYVLRKERRFQLPKQFHPTSTVEVVRKSDKKPMFTFHPTGELIIHAGYAWDGASPKFKLGPIVFGTWDGDWQDELGEPLLHELTLVHDVLVQVRGVAPKKVAYKYKDNDQHFRSGMEQKDFTFTKLYYGAVRLYDILKFWRK
mgnify:CR=1 FL=1|tara:strand:+ start:35 stop:475 length:441 start_codon:yes stop_codon:yes gene_type:complete